MKRIKKDDTVIVNVGKSKKHVGRVLRVADDRVWVEGANLVKKHVKPNQRTEGGIITMESSIHVSNVALYNEETKRGEKVGFKLVDKDGKKYKVRYFKSNDAIIDQI